VYVCFSQLDYRSFFSRFYPDFPLHFTSPKIPATDKVAHMNIYVGEIDAATITVTANYTHSHTEQG